MRHSGIFTTCTTLALVFFFVLGALSLSTANAQTVVGTYLLRQEDGFHRLVTVAEDFNFYHLSSEMESFKFSPGNGVWRYDGNNQHVIKARSVDFDFNSDGSPKSITVVDFDLKFHGTFQSVVPVSTFCGKTFSLAENLPAIVNGPICDPTASGTFSGKFDTGQRVTVP